MAEPAPASTDPPNGRSFPKEINTILESLYSRGMNGWGAIHKESVETAVTTTGLSVSQVNLFLIHI